MRLLPPDGGHVDADPSHNRYDYSVINERKDYSSPEGKRLAFCVTTNVEVYA